MDADFVFIDHGSIVSITPMTDGAKEFIKDNVETEPWQWIGQSLSVDRRYASDLFDAIESAGFSIR